MIKAKHCKLNNRGASLVMVIVIFLFVSIIASVILTMVMRNFESSKLRSESSANFYSAEQAVDEIKTQLERYADIAAKKAYESWLEQYSYKKNAKEREQLFYQVYEEELRKLIKEGFTDDDHYKDFFKDASITWNTGISPQIATPTPVPTGTEPEYDGKLRINDISITFTDETGIATTITTNLDFKITYPNFRVFAATKTLPAADYIVIADGKVHNKLGGDVVNLTGNVYGGDGIYFDGFGNTGTRFTVKADNLITRESFKADNGVQVSVQGNGKTLNKFYGYDTNIWANEISLSKTSGGSGSSAMNVMGNVYLSDDLSLNANDTSFTLKGNYYGYSIHNAKVDVNRNGDPSGSSAIIVNGTNAKLNMLEADIIFVSGKAFISVPATYGSTTIQNFLEGESITYRGLQSAYLLPGECLQDIGHNPIEKTEYDNVLADNGGSLDNIIKTDNYRNRTGIDLDKYLNYEEPVKKIEVVYRKNGVNHTMVYLYLNFRNHDKARDYFQKYYEVNSDLSEKRMGLFGSGQILLNEEALNTTGNAVNYTNNESGKHLDVVNGTGNYSGEVFVSKESELNTKFEALVTTLDENNSGTSLSSEVTEAVVKFSEVDESRMSEVLVDLPGTTKTYYLITGKDIVLKNTKYCKGEGGASGAIVIATGNVEIEGGITFKGLIVAGGDVSITGNTVNLISTPEEVRTLISGNKEVKKYFVIDDSQSGRNDDDGVYVSDLITVEYDQWKKN